AVIDRRLLARILACLPDAAPDAAEWQAGANAICDAAVVRGDGWCAAVMPMYVAVHEAEEFAP
ncbi:MAG: hypothetical protein AABY22_34930, partial [Nanoarchaeota archaeon]